MKKLILLLIVLINTTHIYCQKYDPMLINKKSAGALAEIAIPFYFKEQIRYTPVLIGGIFELPLYKTKKSFNISLSFYPNFAYVFVTDGDAYEFGLNIRANFNFAVNKHNVIRGIIGTGPHFMDYHTSRQAYGFLFSDYVLVGYRRYFIVNDRYCNFDFEIGYRHISNANIKEPNEGISSGILGIGFNILLGASAIVN